MACRRRYFQYRVTEVTGSMEGRIAVGALTFDWWHGAIHTYSVVNLASGLETGTYSVQSEGECSAEQYEQLRRQPAEVSGNRQLGEDVSWAMAQRTIAELTRERDERCPEHEDGPGGTIYVWVCELCGQPLRPGTECNSGIHVGPDGHRRGKAIKSTDLATRAAT